MQTVYSTWPCCVTARCLECSAGAPAPTTLGTHLRSYAFGHVRELDAVAARLLANLAAMTPVLAGVAQVAWIDVDDTVMVMHG